MEIEEVSGTVVGPAPSVGAAVELLKKEEVHGTILDVHLPDGDLGSVVTQLSRLGVPFLFHCGGGLTPALEAEYPNVDIFEADACLLPRQSPRFATSSVIGISNWPQVTIESSCNYLIRLASQ
jgi:hypothetical protein